MPASVSICQVCAVEFTYRKFLEPLCLALAEEGYSVHVAYSGATAAGASPRARQLGLQFHAVPMTAAVRRWRCCGPQPACGGCFDVNASPWCTCTPQWRLLRPALPQHSLARRW